MLSKNKKMALAAGLMTVVGGTTFEVYSVGTLNNQVNNEIERYGELAQLRINIHDKAKATIHYAEIDKDMIACTLKAHICFDDIVERGNPMTKLAFKLDEACATSSGYTHTKIHEACRKTAFYGTAPLRIPIYRQALDCYDLKETCYQKVDSKWFSSQSK